MVLAGERRGVSGVLAASMTGREVGQDVLSRAAPGEEMVDSIERHQAHLSERGQRLAVAAPVV
jgi:hypothetical protein